MHLSNLMPVMNNTKALRDIKTSIYILSVLFFKKLDAVSRGIVSQTRSHFFCLMTQSLFPNEKGEAQEWMHGIHVLQN